jgi:carbamoyltransferase
MGPLSSHKALGRVPSAGNRILIGGGRDLARRCRQHCSESGQSVSGSSFKAPVHALEHHAAHLASAFHVSPFEKAVILSIDGFGDFASAAWGVGEGATVRVDGHVYFPHSLGVFYQAVTQFLGFPHYGDEYEVMELAPYGRPSALLLAYR